MRIALFVTCLVDGLYPEVGKATVRLLRRLGHEVEVPLTQTCCGQMHVNTGYRAQVLAQLVRLHAVDVRAQEVDQTRDIPHAEAVVGAVDLDPPGAVSHADGVVATARTHRVDQIDVAKRAIVRVAVDDHRDQLGQTIAAIAGGARANRVIPAVRGDQQALLGRESPRTATVEVSELSGID